MRSRRSRCLFGLLTATLLSTGALAKDPDAASYSKKFVEWANRLAAVQKADRSQAAVTEVEQIRAIIGQAQAYLASDRIDDIHPLAEHAEVLLGFTTNKVERVNATATADAAEAKAKGLEAQAMAIRGEADKAKKRYDELESQGL